MTSTAAVQDRVQESPRDMNEARAVKQTRPVYTFDFPSGIASTEVQSIGLVQLTSDEEIMATKRASNNPASMAQNLTLQALVEFNGQSVSMADGSTETAWRKLSPKQRGLLITAYGELHTPEDSDIRDFLASQKVRVG